MKKRPAHKFEKERRLVSIVATMANESYLRLSTWFKFGCNAFNEASPQSRPMSFWTEDDVLEYIKLNDIPLASVYGEIFKDEDGGGIILQESAEQAVCFVYMEFSTKKSLTDFNK